MTRNEKMIACEVFFEKIQKKLDGYVVVKSCNADSSAYLVPDGTENDISYYGKPAKSFRISDHWNWRSSLTKCTWQNYIQCWSVDVPYARKREVEGKSTKPRFAAQVAVIGDDGKYHAVYGEIFDRKTKTWKWLNGTVEEALAMI